MRKILIAAMALTIVSGANAQNDKGSITPDVMLKIEKSYQNTATDKALSNAIQANSLKKLALNRENITGEDTYFSNEVKSKGISDQKQSGRCWLFTGLNVMRAKTIQKFKLGDFQFSQNFVSFYDLLEKSNMFLQGVIDNAKKPMDDKLVEWFFKSPIGDGGQFTGIADLITKYGVVPKEVMPESESSESTSVMRELLSRKLREDGLELRQMAANKKSGIQMENRKVEMLGTIYRMLVLNLGKPPVKFTWTLRSDKGKPVSTKEYTPKEFYDTYVGADLKNGYVMFMNDPTREYYKLYTIDLDRHTYEGNNWTYINLPMEDIKKMAIASIKDSTMMYMSCDVSKNLNRSNGRLDVNNYDYESLMGTTFGMNKKERIMTFDSGSTHAMTMMAVDLDANGKPIKWEVENSWGADNGYKGHLIMTDKWLDEYLFRLVVSKNYIPQNILDLLKLKPIKLPAWDPMFAQEEE